MNALVILPPSDKHSSTRSRIKDSFMECSTRIVKVKRVTRIANTPTVCDITVEGNHNLFACAEISDKPVLAHNCAFDVTSLIGIRREQIKYASTLKINGEDYLPKYLKFNLVEMSAIAHDFSHMVEVGVPVDMDYLLYLLSPKSPINDAIKNLRAGFKDFDSVKQTNKLLTKSSQTNGLFGKVESWAFDPGKAEHVKAWMFDTLKLEPVVYTKTGEPSTGKALQTEYKSIPEIAHYTRYKKTIHLKRSFLNPFYNFVAESEDGRTDSCIRPGYGYLDVVSGRSNSFKPSLQQVPQRTEEAKLLKRAFVAGSKKQRRIVIKLDYNTHEVRGWAIVSVDKKLGAQFKRGRILRSKFMLTEDPDLVKQIRLSDLHRINCVSGDSLVPTTAGLLRIDQMADPVQSSAGIRVGGRHTPEKAIAWKYSGVKDTLRLTTELGNSVRVTADHKVLVYDASVGGTVWRKAGECRRGDMLCLNPLQPVRRSVLQLRLNRLAPMDGRGARNRTQIVYPSKMTPQLAQLLAYIVAEGYIFKRSNGAGLQLGNTDKRLLEFCRDALASEFGVASTIRISAIKGSTRTIAGVVTKNTKHLYELSVSSVEFVHILEQLGLYTQQGRRRGKVASHFKVVPWSILESDRESQLAFLAAYLEADGHVSNLLKWCSASKKLLEQMQAILNSHGYAPRLYKAKTCFELTTYSQESVGLWGYLSKYMLSKTLRKVSNTRVSKRGLPTDYWRSLLLDRYVRKDNTNGNATVFLNDDGEEIAIRGGYDYFTKVSHLPYDCKYKDLTTHLRNLKRISGRGYRKLMDMLKSKYILSPITSIRYGGRTKVYDLSIEPGREPSFTANGLVVHNCGIFFGVDIETMDPKELELLRDLVKAIVFGSIYGRSVKSIARATNRPVEEVQKVYDKFFARYASGGDWLDDMREFAMSQLHAFSPLGRKRNLWGYLTGSDAIIAANGRQSINSPIQGMGADIAHLANRLYTLELLKVFKKFGWVDDFDSYEDATTISLPVIQVMVHDSSRTSVEFKQALVVLQLLNWVYTTGTERALKTYFDLDLVCPLEVEFEIGPDDAHLKKWDWSFTGLEKILREGFETAKKEKLIEDLDVDAAMAETLDDWKNSKERRYMDKHYPWWSSDLSGKDAVWKPE